jgi:hypothetical protein
MEARRHKRLIVSLPAEVTAGNVHIAASIENLSDAGVYLITAPSDEPLNLETDTAVELSFILPSLEKINLNCKVRWSYRTPPHRLTNSVGLEIINPSPEFRESLDTLR